MAPLLRARWGSSRIVSRGVVHDAALLPAFVATSENEPSGLITYNIVSKECESVTLDSIRERAGIGTALVEAVRQEAITAGCSRLWLVTTNDNIFAIRFYQKRGFIIKEIHVNSVEELRRLKPEIPLLRFNGIPIRDEVELEMILKP